ncbi:hypothetical protein [Bosea sp. BH3]|uniref:hypothetical protein n=1 Tax=Bosea sp. BH3 TaxID=2871701 RepID=UPI0021CB02A0|nr:hypothetical protein [Bosea sp. BH3]
MASVIVFCAWKRVDHMPARELGICGADECFEVTQLDVNLIEDTKRFAQARIYPGRNEYLSFRA